MRQIDRLRNKIKKYVESPKSQERAIDYRKILAINARLYEIDAELAALSEREYDETVAEKVKNLATEIDSLISSWLEHASCGVLF